MANYPKYQGQRMVKEDEYAYLQELIESHEDPSAGWGGGADYTAGNGIDITGSTISIDNTVALKTEIITSYNDLTDKPTIPTTATSTSSVTPSTIQLTFTYSDNTTETITLMTGASVTTTTTLS